MKNRGFTFIEIIVVLVLFAFSVSLVVPYLSRSLTKAELKGSAQKISAILRYCRSESVYKDQVFQIIFDSALREVRVQSSGSTEKKEEVEKEEVEKKEVEKKEEKGVLKKYSLPEGVHMEEVKIPPLQDFSEFPTIEFYPNGTSNGGTILLVSEGHPGYRIHVHFLTGMVKIVRV
jgi:prepilin-type N-terminal cleavage/methylation domain-containing protein